jgi:hypothetical protein
MSRIDIVGLARQGSGMGTKETTMEYFPPEITADVAQQREALTIEETLGSRAPSGLDYGTRFFELPLNGALRPAAGPRMKSGFLGQPTSVAGAAGDAGSNVHTFDPLAAGKVPEPHSLFCVRKDPNPPIVDLFWDAIGNSFEETYAPNAYVLGTYNWIALDLDDSQSAPSPSRDTSHRWKFSEVTVYINLDGGGEAAVKCAAATVTYNNNLDTDEAVLGSRKLYALPAGNIDCEFRFSPRETLNDYYRESLKADPTTSAARILAKGPAIGATSKFFQLETIIPAFEITEAPAAISGADVLKMIEVTGRAKLDDTSGQVIVQKYTNDVASYA